MENGSLIFRFWTLNSEPSHHNKSNNNTFKASNRKVHPRNEFRNLRRDPLYKYDIFIFWRWSLLYCFFRRWRRRQQQQQQQQQKQQLSYCRDHISAVAWTPFDEKIANRGFHVIKFDNRYMGLTQRFDNIIAPGGGEPSFAYTINDMADDAVAVLNHYGISKAHVIGASIGGLITSHKWLVQDTQNVALL